MSRSRSIATAFAATLLVLSMQAHSGCHQAVDVMSSPTATATATPTPAPTPTTCAELVALGDRHVDLSNRETGVLKQRCDEEDIRAKFAAMDRDSDGYVILEDIPAKHMLYKLFADVDFDGDNRLSLAEVAEYDAETDPIE